MSRRSHFSKKMQGFRNLILLTTSCILTQVLGNIRNEADTCLSKVEWNILKTDVSELLSYNPDCIFINRTNLCDPLQLIEQIVSNPAAIVQVLHEIAELFNRPENPFPNVRMFLIDIYQQYDDLKNCLQPNIDLSSSSARVTQYFQQLHAFLNDGLNTPCVWETAGLDSFIMFQKLAVKKRKIL